MGAFPRGLHVYLYSCIGACWPVHKLTCHVELDVEFPFLDMTVDS